MGGAMAGALGSVLTILLIVGAVWFLFRLFRGKSQMPVPQPVNAYSGGFGGNNNSYTPPPVGASATPEIGSRLQPSAFQPAASGVDLNKPAPAAQPHQPWGVPADFDTASFLRHAKSNFIRLQAAWDKGDVGDIREFTTPEVFAELKMQISERGGKADFTDVVQIDAELLGIENNGADYLASVQFTGSIKPAPDALAEPFNEVWNLVKPVSGNAGWLLAGIQQVA
jgi:predicted lipid-binding transport protein (Tim44 family)